MYCSGQHRDMFLVSKWWNSSQKGISQEMPTEQLLPDCNSANHGNKGVTFNKIFPCITMKKEPLAIEATLSSSQNPLSPMTVHVSMHKLTWVMNIPFVPALHKPYLVVHSVVFHRGVCRTSFTTLASTNMPCPVNSHTLSLHTVHTDKSFTVTLFLSPTSLFHGPVTSCLKPGLYTGREGAIFWQTLAQFW